MTIVSLSKSGQTLRALYYKSRMGAENDCKAVDFAVVQQMNEVSHIKQEENQRPVVEQQTITTQVQKETDTKAEQVQHKENADNHQKKYDAKDKSQNEYPDGHHQGKKGSKDGKFFIKGQEIVDIDIKI